MAHQLFVYTVKQFIFINSFLCLSFVWTQFKFQNPIRCYHSRSELTVEQWPLRGSPHSLYVKGSCFAIRFFNVIPGTRSGVGCYPSAEMQSVYSTTPVGILYTIFYESVSKSNSLFYRTGIIIDKGIIIIIIMSCHQYRYPWPSPVTPPYRPLLPTGLQGYIPYQYKVAVYSF